MDIIKNLNVRLWAILVTELKFDLYFSHRRIATQLRRPEAQDAPWPCVGNWLVHPIHYREKSIVIMSDYKPHIIWES